MRVITVVAADFSRSPLVARCRLCEPLAGVAVLRRTVERVLASGRCGRVYVPVRPAERDACEALLEGLAVAVETHAAPAAPYAGLVAAGRIWGADGWRGGIGGLCSFDEDIHVGVAASLAEREQADAVVAVPGHAALIAPELIDALVQLYEQQRERHRIAFTTAPPGLAPVVLARAFLAELAPTGMPPGSVFVYSPDAPAPDPAGRECCYRPPAVVSETRGRLLADTHRSFVRVERLIERLGAEATAVDVANALRAEESNAAAMPEVIEIELTTEDPLGETTTLRPRGREVGRRGPMRLEHVRRIADSLRPYDDVRILLGGFGDPLAHPDWAEAVRALRAGGAAAIAVRTSGLAGDAATDAALFDLPVDVVCVTLDAATAETYQRVHGLDGFGEATGRIERWGRERVSRRQVRPVLVPEFMKATTNFGEMERFFDEWTRRLGTAVISGPSHYSQRRPDLTVMPVVPPRRVACRRLRNRAMVLADGTVVACDQDYTGMAAVSHLDRERLDEAWRGSGLTALRDGHVRGEYGRHPLCAACEEWHRY